MACAYAMHSRLPYQACCAAGAMESLLGSPNSSRSPWADQQSPEASTSSSLTNVAPMTPGTPTPSQTDPQSPVTPSRPSLSPSQKGVQLQNKAPHWNDTLRCWCLNFRGRVKLASVKNFQLIKADDPNKTIVMQVSLQYICCMHGFHVHGGFICLFGFIVCIWLRHDTKAMAQSVDHR